MPPLTSTLEPMRKVGIALLLFLLALVVFAAGAYTAIIDHWGQPIVTVRVENASGQELRSLVVSYSGYGIKGQVESPPLAPNKSTTLRFYQQGDGSFQITATLADGRIIRDVGGYIQPGYSLAFKVSATTISSVGGFN